MRQITAWDNAWRSALTERADPNRLRRGRSYVRDGRVKDLTIEPGRIIARVEGSRRRVYQVLITVPVLTEDGKSARAMTLVEADIGSDLVPASDTIQFMCTCPDWGDPCKHGAAVWLTVAERIVVTPEPLFTVRGVRSDAVKQLDMKAKGHSSQKEDSGDVTPFWEGDGNVFVDQPDGVHDAGTPAWVFVPPVPWPLKKGPLYPEVMAELYKRMRAGARLFLEGLEEPD